MRILCVHNRYQQRGGEDQVFESEAALLHEAGHDVRRVEFTNSDIPTTLDVAAKLRLAASTIWSGAAAARVREAAVEFSAEVVHFTNTFPLASPSVYSAARSAGATVVQNLQNYRLACPSSELFRERSICEDCLGRTVPWPGVVHGCYRGSRSQTAVVASMLAAHRLRRTWHNEVDAYITPSQFTRSKLIEAGLPADKVHVKPNFLPDYQSSGSETHPRNGFLYTGRLSEQKGIDTLMAAWRHLEEPVSLAVVGSGSLAGVVESAARDIGAISYHPWESRESVLQRMGRVEALVFPSAWYEPFGLVAIEAFSRGTPVIAARSGGIPEIVEHGQTGLLFEAGNVEQLVTHIRWAREHPEEMRAMGANARSKYQKNYTPEQNYGILMDIYDRARSRARNGR